MSHFTTYFNCLFWKVPERIQNKNIQHYLHTPPFKKVKQICLAGDFCWIQTVGDVDYLTTDREEGHCLPEVVYNNMCLKTMFSRHRCDLSHTAVSVFHTFHRLCLHLGPKARSIFIRYLPMYENRGKIEDSLKIPVVFHTVGTTVEIPNGDRLPFMLFQTIWWFVIFFREPR